MATLKPLFSRVLLKREPLRSSSLIITPSAAKKNAPTRGIVVAVGPTADKSIKVGATYDFGVHAGAWIRPDGRPAADDGAEAFFITMDEDLLVEVEE